MPVPEFCIGEDVVLNSGGPWMTIVGYTDDNQLIVQWIGDDDEIHTAQFPDVMVVGARGWGV